MFIKIIFPMVVSYLLNFKTCQVTTRLLLICQKSFCIENFPVHPNKFIFWFWNFHSSTNLEQKHYIISIIKSLGFFYGHPFINWNIYSIHIIYTLWRLQFEKEKACTSRECISIVLITTKTFLEFEEGCKNTRNGTFKPS